MIGVCPTRPRVAGDPRRLHRQLTGHELDHLDTEQILTGREEPLSLEELEHQSEAQSGVIPFPDQEPKLNVDQRPVLNQLYKI